MYTVFFFRFWWYCNASGGSGCACDHIYIYVYQCIIYTHIHMEWGTLDPTWEVLFHVPNVFRTWLGQALRSSTLLGSPTSVVFSSGMASKIFGPEFDHPDGSETILDGEDSKKFYSYTVSWYCIYMSTIHICANCDMMYLYNIIYYIILYYIYIVIVPY